MSLESERCQSGKYSWKGRRGKIQFPNNICFLEMCKGCNDYYTANQSFIIFLLLNIIHIIYSFIADEVNICSPIILGMFSNDKNKRKMEKINGM
jgi:hypothetical protein